MFWWQNNNSVQEFLRHYRAKKRDIVLFLGAGIVAPYFPTWTELLKLMVVQIKDQPGEITEQIESEIRRGSLVEAATLCKKFLGEGPYFQILRNIFIKPDLNAGKIARIFDLKKMLSIENSPVRAMITTNFDSLTPDIAPIPDLSLKWNDSLKTFNQLLLEKKRFLLHFHGRISDEASIILTAEDYTNLTQRQEVISIFRQLLAQSIVLYLGFGLQDHDFGSILRQIRSLFGGGWNDQFAMFPSPTNQYEHEHFRHIKLNCELNDIMLIEYNSENDHEALNQFIHFLSNLCAYSDVKIQELFASIQKKEIEPRFESPDPYEVQPSEFRDVFFQRINGREAVRGREHKIEHIKNSLINVNSGTILVIGEAGIGKTTLCRWLSKDIASSFKTNEISRKHHLPIYISLREFCPQNLEALLHSTVPGLDFDMTFKELKDMCSQEDLKLLLFLDGLNEIDATMRDLVVSTVYGLKKISGFSISILFTSRSVGVTEKLLTIIGDDVPIFEIQRWNYDLLSQYLSKNNLDLNLLNGLSIEMRSSLCLPLFAWLFVQAQRNRAARTFHTIGEVFNDFIDTWLEPSGKQSESYQVLRKLYYYELPKHEKKTVIAKMAFIMTKEGTLITNCGKLESVIKKNQKDRFRQMALELINSGVLRLVDKAALDMEIDVNRLKKTKVMFLHQALQEYLTAKFITENPRYLTEMPVNLSVDAFWRDVPIYMIRLRDQQKEEERKKVREFIGSFMNSAEPDFWTAARLIKEINPIDQNTMQQKVSTQLIQNLSKGETYSHSIEAFAELGEFGRQKLIDELNKSKHIEAVLAIPESHLYRSDKLKQAERIFDRESIWCSLGRPIYVLGELGEARLVSILLSRLDRISSIHLIYHTLEAFLSIIRLEPDNAELYNNAIHKIKQMGWLNHADPVIMAYSAAIIREVKSKEELPLEAIARGLISFLHKKSSSQNKYFEDEFWQRAHGVEVLSEIANANEALHSMRELLIQENVSEYTKKVNGYLPIHAAILKGAIRLRMRLKVGFLQMRELLESAVQSERIGINNWACRHLENLLLLICTEKETDWLKAWLTETTLPLGTVRVIRNVAHSLISRI